MEGFTRIRINELVWEARFRPNASTERLRISAEPLRYHLEVVSAEGSKRLKSFDAKLVSTECGGRFTGVSFALYAEGEVTLSCESFEVNA